MPRSRTLLALCAASAVLAGCGEPEVYRTDRPILRVKLDEYRIVPQNASVKAGRMKFAVRNTGKLTHNLVIQLVPDRFAARPIEIGRTQTMQSQQTGEPIKLELTPGTYRLVCTIANHKDLGQFGELKVRR
jgi:uncharacterized cupredoxin-like copper-binding protein